MKLHLLAVLLALSACNKASTPKTSTPSCSEQVATLSAALATPRSLAEIRKSASPTLATDLDHVATQPEGAARAIAYAEHLEKAVAGCPDAVKVFGDIASIEGSRSSYLQQKFPPALEACACAASPEHAGGLVEALLADGWKEAPH